MPAPLLFSNFATVWLTSPLTAGAVTITLNAGEGELFPTPAAGAIFVGVLEDTRVGAREIVNCVARDGDVLTVQRGQEGTIARSFAAYTTFSNRLTAGAIARLFETAPAASLGRAYVGDTPPDSPVSGALWFDTARLLLFVYFDDGDSGQWVQAVPS